MARIGVDGSTHDFYRELTEKGATRVALFKTMKDAFMFNFVIGVRNGIRVELKSRVEIFESGVLDPGSDTALLNGVFLSFNDDLLALSVESGERISSDVLRFSEEFANAGVNITRRSFNIAQPELSLFMLLATGQ
jgi:hypothetical protein